MSEMTPKDKQGAHRSAERIALDTLDIPDTDAANQQAYRCYELQISESK